MYAKKVDGNQAVLVHAAERIGAAWVNLSTVGRGVFDGVICWRGQVWFVEFKNRETSYGKKGLNPAQRLVARKLARVGVTVHEISTEEELLEMMGVVN